MKLNSGQSMFEVVIALFIISMIIVGVVSLSTNSLSNTIFSRNKTLAGRYSQEAVEWLRSQREENTSAFLLNVATSTYCLDNLSWMNAGSCGSSEVIPGTIFTREVSFGSSSISGKNIIEVDITTSWSDSKGYHEAKSVTNFSDIREK
jgi:Tfp pilus assembly protein PilV